MSLSVRALVPERGVDLRLEVPSGRTLALIGPNGAGKSTVLSLVAGTLRTPRSEVILDGRVLGGPQRWVPPHERRVTTLHQDPVLFPHLTAQRNTAFPLRAQGTPRRIARREALEWLSRLGVGGLAGRRPAQLSGGQAQRVALARALAADPALLLLDEPFAALDIEVAAAMRDQLRTFLEGRTAVLVTHDVLDVFTLADHVVVLEDGRVCEQGPARELLARPRSAFTARFAGLTLLQGTWVRGDHGRGALRLTDGQLLPSVGDLPADAEARAVLRPAALRIATEEESGILRTVTGLLPHGDLIRVRTEDLVADLLPQEVALHEVRPGARVRLAAPAEAVTAYGA